MKSPKSTYFAQIGLGAAIAVTLAVAALSTSAQPTGGPQEPPALNSFDQIILRAARGEYPATGPLSGPLADRIKAVTKSNEPLVGTAWRIGQLSQAGCWRVRFSMYQDKVPTKNGGFAPFTGGFDLNICEDGDAPLPT